MRHPETRFSMAQTEEWLDHLRATNRKENTITTHRNNVHRCLLFLWGDNRPTDAPQIDTDDIQYLWRSMPVKESVRMAYLRSLSCMIEFHTGTDLVKRTDILHNREARERVFITDEDFRTAYRASDPFQRVVLCLGAYMGLRRVEMQSIRDCDIDRGVLTIHGKGHGIDGLVAYMDVPQVGDEAGNTPGRLPPADPRPRRPPPQGHPVQDLRFRDAARQGHRHKDHHPLP